MRTLSIMLLAALAVIASAADEKAPVGENVLTRYLDQANVHPPVQVGPLTVFPISLNRTERLAGLLTMEQALDRKLLAIEELDSPEVSRARFVNKSARDMIFLMAGEVITGGKQNRTMATDAVLAPDSATVLPIYCVEKRRWEGRKEFAPTVTVAPQAVRERAAQSAGQAEVWDEVARANVRLKSSSSSDDLAAGMTKPENARRLTELRKHVVDRLPDNCAGIVVARGGTIIGADLFNSADLFATMRQRVLDSYLSQYALEEGDRPMRVMPDQREVREYLQGCYRSRLAAEDMRGVGQVYGISGNRTGRMLAYEPRFAVEVRERPIRPANQYMVHTSLMQEVIPVRPRPIPMPQGRPER